VNHFSTHRRTQQPCCIPKADSPINVSFTIDSLNFPNWHGIARRNERLGATIIVSNIYSFETLATPYTDLTLAVSASSRSNEDREGDEKLEGQGPRVSPQFLLLTIRREDEEGALTWVRNKAEISHSMYRIIGVCHRLTLRGRKAKRRFL
jgi:hypothetical protein